MKRAVVGLLALGLVACKPPANAPPPRNTLVVGLDISGSFRKSGYFDEAAELKPLLHLWSLGIEEQFYILWPLALFLLWRLRRGRLALLLTAARREGISLALAREATLRFSTLGLIASACSSRPAASTAGRCYCARRKSESALSR